MGTRFETSQCGGMGNRFETSGCGGMGNRFSKFALTILWGWGNGNRFSTSVKLVFLVYGGMRILE